MKKHVAGALALAVMVCTAFAAGAQSGEWKEYVYRADGFAVAAPRQPVMSKRTVDKAPGGPVEIHFYNIDTSNGTGLMAIASDRHPNDRRAAQQVLSDAKTGGAAAAKATIDAERPISLDNNPGLEIEFSNDKYHGRTRVYLVGRKLYQIMSVAPASQPLPSEADRFYKSFRLVSRSN